MFNSVNFYQHHGNGDIFESRQFCIDTMNLVPTESEVSTYYHGKSHRLLMDIPNLVTDNNVPDWLDPMKPHVIKDGSLYLNTWIGRQSSYVLGGSACTIEMLHKMHNDQILPFNVQLSSSNPIDYLTNFRYELYEIDGIKEFLGGKENQRKVYVSNGNVHSAQAENFDMSPLIISLAKTFPDVLLFITQGFENFEENIIDANTLTPSRLDSNLVELAYLSESCDLLLGRNSGAHVFAWTKNNCLEREIVNVTLSYHVDCAHFIYDSPMKMRKMWSNSTSTEELTAILSKIIKENVL